MAVGVNLLGVEVLHDLHRALAEDVLLEDVAQRSLRVHGEQQHFMAVLRQPERRGRGKSSLPQPALAAEHDVLPFLVFLEGFSQ